MSENNDIERRVSDLEVAMRGDLKGNNGIMQNMIRLMNDVYQPPQGLAPRLKALEDMQLKAQGVAWLVKILWVILAFGLGLAAAKFWK